MKKVLVGSLAAIGILVVLVFCGGLLVFLVSRAGKGGVASHTVLEIDLERTLPESRPDHPVAQLLDDGTPTVRDLVEGLAKAAEDDRVVGLVARVGESATGLARIQEIRDAVLAFRKKGKLAVAFAETFGEFGPGNRSYYLATAFDPIWLQPSGDIGLTGLIAESPFLRGTLDKLNVVPRLDHRHEYKNAMNVYTEKAYTAAHREATQKVIDSMFSQIVKGIADARKLSEDDVRALADKGPYLGKEAADRKLVDGLAYRDEVLQRLEEKLGAKVERLPLTAYLDRAGRPHEKGDTVALVYGVGPVVRGKSKYSPVSGEVSMGSDSVASALRQATEDSSVKAIVFRVDSPGGSYVASDTIWRETVRAKKAGKPVIVSMGDVAGSGGYFVAMAADKIVAQPATITGSIGVLGGKLLLNGAFEKLGISWDEVHTSKNAVQWSTTRDYSEEGWARFQASLDRIYEDFTTKAAEGRKMPKEALLEIAKGRIWSGEDARKIGLVDEVGGLETALRLAKVAAKIPEKSDVKLRVFPREKTILEKLMAKEDKTEEVGAAEVGVAAVAEALRTIQPAARVLQRAGVLEDPGILSMRQPDIR